MTNGSNGSNGSVGSRDWPLRVTGADDQAIRETGAWSEVTFQPRYDLPQLPLVNETTAAYLRQFGWAEGTNFYTTTDVSPAIRLRDDIYAEMADAASRQRDHEMLCGLNCDGNPHKIDAWEPTGLSPFLDMTYHEHHYKEVEKHWRENLARKIYAMVARREFPSGH
jgi:hypothetical protein